jgi:hypothetical protein
MNDLSLQARVQTIVDAISCSSPHKNELDAFQAQCLDSVDSHIFLNAIMHAVCNPCDPSIVDCGDDAVCLPEGNEGVCCFDVALETMDGVNTGELEAYETGATLWHDRGYSVPSVPEWLVGGHYIEQPVKSIPQGSVIHVTTAGKAILYVCFEGPSGRNGGFPTSLPTLGFTQHEGAFPNGCCNMICYYREEPAATEVDLPPVTTGETVMSVVVVPDCQ